jgi:hypothetical protein
MARANDHDGIVRVKSAYALDETINRIKNQVPHSCNSAERREQRPQFAMVRERPFLRYMIDL